MKRWAYLWAFLSGVFLAVVLGLATSATFKASIVAAQQTAKASGQKWEYCSLGRGVYFSDNFGRKGWRAEIHYFQSEGRKDEIVESGRPDVDAKAIAKLGNEGWEMVGGEVIGEKSDFVSYIFKRPRP